MAKLKEELLKTLKNLTEDEFNEFKWFLQQDDILEGFKGIPVAQLEKAGRPGTVDLMVQKYQDHGALKLTMKVLEMINRNDLVQRLQNSPSGPKGGERSTSATVVQKPTTSEQPAGPGPAETPSVPADEKLMSVREQFIDGVSEANLRKLLDKLLQRGVINDGEMESARTPNRADKAGQVIDMVRKKGPKASSVLIAALCEVDQFLSEKLKLQ